MVTTRRQASTGTADVKGPQTDPKGATEKMEYKVRYQGRWFDIGNFAGKHPGGSQILKEVTGKDIDTFLDGDPVNGSTHKHSANAYRILAKYALDREDTSEEELIDIEKPILAQVGKLGKHYWKWIHTPIDKDLRMFESDAFEWLTRNNWYTIPAVWIPLVILLSSWSYGLFHTEYGSSGKALGVSGGLFCCGMLVWSLMEYVLHRFAFHWVPPPDSPRIILFHFILHGLHHKTPMDGGRLVFPPLMALAVVIPVLATYWWLLPWPITLAACAGNLFGYVCYDMTHYYLHHGIPSPGTYFHMLKQYHHAHHFKNPDKSYGISSKLWDWPFRTVGAPQ